jgi:hypothetical protein
MNSSHSSYSLYELFVVVDAVTYVGVWRMYPEFFRTSPSLTWADHAGCENTRKSVRRCSLNDRLGRSIIVFRPLRWIAAACSSPNRFRWMILVMVERHTNGMIISYLNGYHSGSCHDVSIADC